MSYILLFNFYHIFSVHVLEFVTVSNSLQKISEEFHIQKNMFLKDIKSQILKEILEEIPELLHDISIFSKALNLEALK